MIVTSANLKLSLKMELEEPHLSVTNGV